MSDFANNSIRLRDKRADALTSVRASATLAVQTDDTWALDGGALFVEDPKVWHPRADISFVPARHECRDLVNVVQIVDSPGSKELFERDLPKLRMKAFESEML